MLESVHCTFTILPARFYFRSSKITPKLVSSGIWNSSLLSFFYFIIPVIKAMMPLPSCLFIAYSRIQGCIIFPSSRAQSFQSFQAFSPFHSYFPFPSSFQMPTSRLLMATLPLLFNSSSLNSEYLL